MLKPIEIPEISDKFYLLKDTETEQIIVKTRKPFKIVNGYLEGSDIDLYDDKTYRIWTNKVKKASLLALKYNLDIVHMNRECELLVPIQYGDKILPLFGAKNRRKVSEKQLNHLKRVRQGKFFG